MEEWIMQLGFFLLPKSEASFLLEEYTLRQALEKMQYHGYMAVPLLNQAGQYVGTITVGDLLWYIKDKHRLNISAPDKNHEEQGEQCLDLSAAEKVLLKEVPRRRDNIAVGINADMRDLLQTAMVENFIPVTDDSGVFIGIVTRREILKFCSGDTILRELEEKFQRKQKDD
jgi:CBS domain-containing protein